MTKNRANASPLTAKQAVARYAADGVNLTLAATNCGDGVSRLPASGQAMTAADFAALGVPVQSTGSPLTRPGTRWIAPRCAPLPAGQKPGGREAGLLPRPCRPKSAPGPPPAGAAIFPVLPISQACSSTNCQGYTSSWHVIGNLNRFYIYMAKTQTASQCRTAPWAAETGSIYNSDDFAINWYGYGWPIPVKDCVT